MDRRTFLKNSIVTFGGSAWSTGAGSHSSLALGGNYPGKPPIQYLRTAVPAFEVPAYRGQRYEDEIPDTLDLATRAELGVRVLTNIADPKLDYQVYWIAQWDRNPAVMVHLFSDWVQSVEGLMEDLPLLRVATGSSYNDHVDPEWMRNTLKCQGPDGLVYVPLIGVPSSRIGGMWVTPLWRADGTATTDKDPTVSFMTAPCMQARLIGTFTVYYLRDKNPLWKQVIEGMIQRLAELAVDRGTYAYIPRGGLEPNARFGPAATMPTGVAAVEGGNLRLLQGLAQYYQATQYEPARQLALKLAQYAMGPAESLDAEGRFLFSEMEKGFVKDMYPGIERGRFGGHFHAHTIALLSLLEYSTAMSDRYSLELCRKSYEWAKNQGSSTVGFFPEMILGGHYTGCEGCEIGDMISIAIKLTAAAKGDYWDDVDRWLRNQFAEQQVVEGDWIPQLAATQKPLKVEYNETDQQVVERSIGGFLGRATFNEAGFIETHCCTGNCLRALYHVWEHLVEDANGRLRVNLLLNHASDRADIYSDIPYQGRVELKIKKPVPELLVRAPEWIENGSPRIAATVNGAPHKFHWEERYLHLGFASPGDRVRVTFPIAERTVKETIGAVPYTLIIRGNTVVSVDPPGKLGALYQRAAYRKDEAPLRKVRRFVPEQPIVW